MTSTELNKGAKFGTLADTDVRKIYRLIGFEDPSSAYADKLRHMGFTDGTPVKPVQGA